MLKQGFVWLNSLESYLIYMHHFIWNAEEVMIWMFVPSSKNSSTCTRNFRPSAFIQQQYTHICSELLRFIKLPKWFKVSNVGIRCTIELTSYFCLPFSLKMQIGLSFVVIRILDPIKVGFPIIRLQICSKIGWRNLRTLYNSQVWKRNSVDVVPEICKE